MPCSDWRASRSILACNKPSLPDPRDPYRVGWVSDGLGHSAVRIDRCSLAWIVPLTRSSNPMSRCTKLGDLEIRSGLLHLIGRPGNHV